MLEKTLIAHVTVSITLNQDTTWVYTAPNVERQFVLSVPLGFMNGKVLTELVETAVKELKAEFPKAVEEHEAEKARKEAEKAEALGKGA